MNWDTYFMEFAKTASSKSKDSTKVGAILVDPDGAVILTAFNGPPRGVKDYPSRFEKPNKYLFASHAETNLISFAARRGIMTKDCEVYCTHISCASCARTLIQAGIKKIVYGPGTFSNMDNEVWATKIMCEEANVELIQYDG
jgi:dCMP deaminase